MNRLEDLKKELIKLADPVKAALLMRFFKTGPGEYGEGDIFLGIMVPQSRQLVRKFRDLELRDIIKLLRTDIHEQRLIALLILVEKFERGDEMKKKKIFDLYLKNTDYINNWDLVDLTAPKIVGAYLLNRPRMILYKLVRSRMLWERRIAVLATATFIREGQFDDILLLSEKLLADKHDLMHKAVGWMLREVGKRDEKILEVFLEKFSKRMPRTMLRYSIEKFPQEKRKRILNNK